MSVEKMADGALNCYTGLPLEEVDSKSPAKARGNPGLKLDGRTASQITSMLQLNFPGIS